MWLDPGVQTFLGSCVEVALKQTVSTRGHVWPLDISQFCPTNLTSLREEGIISTFIAVSQDFMSLTRLSHRSILEPITEAKGQRTLIDHAGSLIHP